VCADPEDYIASPPRLEEKKPLRAAIRWLDL
jgi:hypothetical protein